MNDNERELIKHFENVFGSEIVDKFLEPNELKLKKKNDLVEEIKKYKRWEKLMEKSYKIKGCIYCIENNENPLAVRNQDFPGWKGHLKDKDLIVIGLEVGPQVITDIHIAYNLGGKIRNQDKIIYDNIGILFNNFEERAYITDIAKCLSTKVNISREKCLEKHFFKELKLVSKIIKPNFKIIIQSFEVENYIENIKNITIINAEKKPEEKPVALCKLGTLSINNEPRDVIIVPHSGKRVAGKWKRIKEPVNLNKIKSLINK